VFFRGSVFFRAFRGQIIFPSCPSWFNYFFLSFRLNQPTLDIILNIKNGKQIKFFRLENLFLNWDVIVIGGGPAGMMSAGTAGSRGRNVLLLERNDKLGKKLFLTGQGRCNLTNADENLETFIQNTITNGKFLHSAFRSFSNLDLMNFFEDLGLNLKVERGRRVFPVSEKSSDVTKALKKFLDNNKVTVHFNSRVKEILSSNNAVVGVKLETNETLKCKKVVLATGGVSYSTTGSTGDGYRIAEKLGHKIMEIKPSLVPIETEEDWVTELQGLSLRNVAVTLLVNDEKIHREFGEMIFTHFGVSGPIILTISAYLKNYLVFTYSADISSAEFKAGRMPALQQKKNKIALSLDLKPALSHKQLDERLLRDFAKYSKRQFRNSLGDLLPKAMIPIMINLSGIDKNKNVSELTKEERKILLNLFKGLRLKVKGLSPLEEAIITSGGISTKEINPSTMESKIIQGLFFAGEIIDVDALTGGFNLQIAFSTGHLAGISNADILSAKK